MASLFLLLLLSSVSHSHLSFFCLFLSGLKELKQLYNNVLAGALFSFPTLSFLFWLNVNSYCIFRQEMPNGFPKTYSWHGNEIQICKTFLTWKKRQRLCPDWILFFSYSHYSQSHFKMYAMETKQKKELKCGNNWGIYWSVTYCQNTGS